MNALSLTPAERQQIDQGAWFSKLSEALRNDILQRAFVRRLADETMLSHRGEPAEESVSYTHLTLPTKRIV